MARGIANSMIPSNKQSFALRESSLLITKYAIIPPMIVKNIGNKNHHALRFLYLSKCSDILSISYIVLKILAVYHMKTSKQTVTR